MIKPKSLKKGDKVAIVSLSRGLLGNPHCSHEVEIGLKRLRDYGLNPVIMSNSALDANYLEEHPEARAEDLKQAFLDDDIKMIITAIGGNDTYKLIPYLMDDVEFRNAVVKNPKIFVGFSDTTNNHLMFNRLGLSTFYGPCFLIDLAELDREMLPYTREHFETFFRNDKSIEIKSSPIWYSDRESYGKSEVGKPREAHEETHGFEILNGSGIFRGKLYGGCIESIYDAMTGAIFEDEPEIYEKYDIFPMAEEWREKILFLETSELRTEPSELEKMLLEFKKRGILSSVRGVIVGKPMDEVFYPEYIEVYKRVFADLETPVLYNVNFGHAVPRCILPYDAIVTVDFDDKRIIIDEPILDHR